MNLKIKELTFLSERTKSNLVDNCGYEFLTKVQEKVIPRLLEQGKNKLDYVIQSRTGSGKTATFIIPIVEKLTAISEPQVLVLTPTRELALQVSEEAKKLSRHTELKTLAIYGGDDVEKQLRELRKGIDIIIGTPGRIFDHLERGLSFNKLKYLV